MPSKKNILIVADPYLPIPPPLYGGVERIINGLVKELKGTNYEVTTICHPDSTCDSNRISWPRLDSSRKSRLINMIFLTSHVMRHSYDIVQSYAHHDIILPLWPLKQSLIQSFQAFPSTQSFSKRTRLVPYKNLHFTVCGQHMVNSFQHIAPTTAIHNFVDIENFDYQPTISENSPLVFLGRVEEIKGAHLAIDIATASGSNLTIAGNRSSNSTADRYFEEQIKPRLNEKITYIGPVNDSQKNTLLKKAAALLMPILWDEPFGIVMAEALACGTPVIGLDRGAVSEIISHNKTGFCCSSVSEMITAVGNLNQISRLDCRKHCEMYFSSDQIINQYISLYESMIP